MAWPAGTHRYVIQLDFCVLGAAGGRKVFGGQVGIYLGLHDRYEDRERKEKQCKQSKARKKKKRK